MLCVWQRENRRRTNSGKTLPMMPSRGPATLVLCGVGFIQNTVALCCFWGLCHVFCCVVFCCAVYCVCYVMLFVPGAHCQHGIACRPNDDTIENTRKTQAHTLYFLSTNARAHANIGILYLHVHGHVRIHIYTEIHSHIQQQQHPQPRNT